MGSYACPGAVTPSTLSFYIPVFSKHFRISAEQKYGLCNRVIPTSYCRRRHRPGSKHAPPLARLQVQNRTQLQSYNLWSVEATLQICRSLIGTTNSSLLPNQRHGPPESRTLAGNVLKGICGCANAAVAARFIGIIAFSPS